MKNKHTMDLTKGSVIKTLLLFTLPIFVGNLMQQLYNTADMIVVGQFVGDSALAAVGSTGELTALLVTLFSGLAIGANIICSNRFGAGDKDGLSRSMHTIMPVALASGIILAFGGVVFARPLLQLTGCPDNVIGQATLYMQIYFAGSPASMIYNFGSAILRAHGDSNRPMTILIVTGVINVVLNVILVSVFRIGVAGVAIATVAAQVVSAVVVLKILLDPKEEYRMQLKNMRIYRAELVQLLRVGIPCGINSAIFCIANVLLQASINSLGDIAMAGSAASGKISSMVYTIPNSIYASCVSMAGQCYGAQAYKRIDEIWGKSIAVSAGITAAISLLLTFFGEPVVSLFSSSPEVIREAIPKMLLFCWSYVLYAVVDCTIGCVRGMGFATTPTLLNIFCITAPRLLWNFFIFPLNPNLFWLHLCIPISYVLCMAAQVIYYRRCRKALGKRISAA